MKRAILITIACLAMAAFAAAQGPGWQPTTDVLGAHLNYGRGCPACHAPHSGAYGNGAAKTADATAGDVALWGQDVASLYSKTITSGSTNGSTGYLETLPASMTAGTPDVLGLLTCLSCHDGNYAKGAMMKNAVYETLPATYGTYNTIPTLLGNDDTTVGNYLNDHPVGLNATIGCGGQYNWDCTIAANGHILMTGAASSKFVTNYGFFVSPGYYNDLPVVVCTTCHNQHLMNVVSITTATQTGLASGTYATMFFVRAPYNPADANPLTNQTAQFCRQCHGGESNEMNNGTAVTVF